MIQILVAPITQAAYTFKTSVSFDGAVEKLKGPLPIVFQSTNGPITIEQDEEINYFVVQEISGHSVVRSQKIEMNREIPGPPQGVEAAITLNEVPLAIPETPSDQNQVQEITLGPTPDGSFVVSVGDSTETVYGPVTPTYEVVKLETPIYVASLNIEQEEKMEEEKVVVEPMEIPAVDETVSKPVEKFVSFRDKCLGLEQESESWENSIIDKHVKMRDLLKEIDTALDDKNSALENFKKEIVGK